MYIDLESEGALVQKWTMRDIVAHDREKLLTALSGIWSARIEAYSR